MTTEARNLARDLLVELPERWAHTVGVAHRAAELAPTVPSDQRSLLVAAAWLHDIGYAQPLRETGFHPVDGARHLTRSGWPPDVDALVAHHSGARFVASMWGLDAEMALYGYQDSPLTDALTYADQTIGPAGGPVTVQQRMADMLHRHGSDSPNARAHPQRGPYLLQVSRRMQQRLAEPLTRSVAYHGRGRSPQPHGSW